MPAFQPLSATKRKHDEEEDGITRKRVSTGPRMSSGYDDETWMVQWCVVSMHIMLSKESSRQFFTYRRNLQTKKHKTWDGDGVLVSKGNGESMLYDIDGAMYVSAATSISLSKYTDSMSSGKVSLPLFEGKGLFFGSKEIELERLIPRSEFLSGICFGHSLPSGSVSCPITKAKPPAFKLPQNKENFRLSNATDQVTTGTAPQDITNYSLHWTANWCAYTSPFKFIRSYVVGGNVENKRTRHGTGTHTFR